MARILTGAATLDRADHLEQIGAFGPGGLDELGSRDGGLNVTSGGQIHRRDASEGLRGDLQQSLLEPLPLLARVAGDLVHGLAPALGVGRLEGVDVAARAE